MPSAPSDRAKRKARRDKKKPKADNYRKGCRSIYFDYYLNHPDLDVLIQQKLDEIEGKTDEESHNKRDNLRRMQANLPKNPPSRDGYPPLTGERNHFYLRFFHYLTQHIESGRYNKRMFFNYETYQDELRFADWQDFRVKAFMGFLYYFDIGPDYQFAFKPHISRQALAHIRHMKAKRKREAKKGK
jgi:hypothetical protein